jgi:hypothetical protein
VATDEVIGNQPALFQPRMGARLGDGTPVLPAPGRAEYVVRSRDGVSALGRYDPFQPYWGIWEHISAPWRNIFDPNSVSKSFTDRMSRSAFLFVCGLWALAVWALFGGMITRAAAIELATRDRAKTGRTIRYAVSKWQSYAAGPFFTLFAVLLIGVPIAVIGLFLRTEITGWVAALVWPFLLVDGFLMALLLAGLLFGWPLMWANISVEGVDSFDAVGRAYNYVFQRPLQYLFYALIATALGALGWLFVWNFVAAIVGLTYGAAAWGAGSGQMEVMFGGRSGDLGAVSTFSAWLITFWAQCLKLLGVGFLYSYFWTASTAIYYLLRRDADATEMDEVCPEEEEQLAPAVPPTTTPTSGTPANDEKLPESQAE